MNNYRCKKCDKFIPVDQSKINPGDKVNFTKVVKKGQRIRMTSVTGIVADASGDACDVRYRGGILRLKRNELTPVDAPSQLTYAFCGTCDCQPTAAAVEVAHEQR